eukprot:scaffold39179_cov50-Attheya_sp.AAC.3
MDLSGCRSRVNCTVGSGGMAIENPPSSSLVVAEWGQERIIRLESETGSRTPLVWTVPYSSSSSTTTTHNTNPVTHQQQQQRRRRVHRPNHLLYTPFGDLLFVDHEALDEKDPTVSVAGIYRLREAVHVPPLPPHKSREAHDWTEMPAAITAAPAATELLFQEHVQQIGGLALDANLTGIYVSAIVPTIHDDQEQHQRHVLLHIPLQEDDDETENDSSDDNDSQKEEVGAKKELNEDGNEKEDDPSMDRIQKGLLDGTAREVMDLTPLHKKGSHGNGSRMLAAGPVTVDEKGHVYVAVGGSLIVLNPSGSSVVLGVIPLGLNNDEGDSILITDVVLGEDGFLYVSTLHQLLRLRTKAKPMSVPTNLIPPKRTQGFTWD